MASSLLQIVLGELEGGDDAGELLFQEIFQTLRNHGFSGATGIRTNEGLGENNEFRSVVLEDISFNNLPIVIESVDERDKVRALLPELKKKIPHGEIVTMQAIRILEEELLVNDDEYLMLKIYLKEQSHGFKLSNYEELLKLIRNYELIWSTITKGIEGFGKDREILKQSLFSISSHVPVVIESVGKASVIRKMIPVLKEKVKEGLVIAIPVQVFANH